MVHGEAALRRYFLQIPVTEEYRKYQRTHSTMIPSSKCRPRNRADRLLVKVHLNGSARAVCNRAGSSALVVSEFH
jgi:hypothetical protein